MERHLENWIEADSTLIGGGLTIVGRQITIDDGRLDLLAIDSHDQWVVIEIKPGVLGTGALNQALYYASSLARLSAEDLRTRLTSWLKGKPDATQRLARISQLLDDESERRDITVLLVGIGSISPGLQRMKDFLGHFEVPISTVTFEVFSDDPGSKLLIREVIEEPSEPTVTPKRRPMRSLEGIRQRAVKAGVGAQFDRFVKMSEDAGLAVRPYRVTVMIAPPANRARFLMYATPRHGGIEIAAGPGAFAEFFDVTIGEAKEALGPSVGRFLKGAELDARLDQIERFLVQKLRKLQADGDGVPPDEDTAAV